MHWAKQTYMHEPTWGCLGVTHPEIKNAPYNNMHDVRHAESCPCHEQNQQKPMYRPMRALGQVVLDGIIIAVSYAFLSCALENCEIKIQGLVTFFSVFIPLGFFLRTMDLEYQETLGRVAMYQIGTKLFNVLTIF